MYLSPIRFLIEDVKSIFKINNQDFFDAVQVLTSSYDTKIKISIVCKSLTGIRELGANCNVKSYIIKINECLLCAIWCVSYFVANAYVALSDYLNESKPNLLIESDTLALIKYAKSLVPSFDDWPDGLPIPQDSETNPYAKLANMIMPIATDVILCHELAHLTLNHTKDGGIKQEVEADNIAINWILNQAREEYPVKELAVMTAFVTMILIDANADKEGQIHPSSFDRMINYLEDLKIDGNDVLWVLAILTYRAWENSFDKFSANVSQENDTFKNSFKSLISENNLK